MSQYTVSAKRTYIPGFAKAKAVLALCGLGLALLGAIQLYDPARAIVAGRSAVAEVVAIAVERAGFPTDLHRVPRAYEEDQVRRIVFGYQVRIPARAEPIALNIKNRVRPAYAIGEGIRVTWIDDAPYVFAVLDLRTWAPGLFLLVSGLVFGGAFAHLLLRSRRPIRLPDDIPSDTVL